MPIVENANADQIIYPGMAKDQSTYPAYQFSSHDHRESITTTGERATIKATKYNYWNHFHDFLIGMTMSKFSNDLGAIAGIERVGLRYINEVKISGSSMSLDQWSKYINVYFLSANEIMNDKGLILLQSMLYLKVDNFTDPVLRSGILDGHVADDSGPLRLSSPVIDGLFF